MIKYVIPLLAASLIMVGCQSKSNDADKNGDWTIENIDDWVFEAGDSDESKCKHAEWVVADEHMLMDEFVGLVDAPEFTQEVFQCDMGKGITKYIFKESLHEYYSEYHYYEKDGKLMYYLQTIHSESDIMFRKIYWDKDGKILKGINSYLLEEDEVTVKDEYKDSYDESIRDNSYVALEQFKELKEKLKQSK